jgi:hypothetical protein
MSESLETTAQAQTPQVPSTLLKPLGAIDADVCVDGVCVVPPAEARELVDED